MIENPQTDCPTTGDSDLIAALYWVMVRHEQGFATQVDQLLRLGCSHLNLGIGIVAHVAGERYSAAHVFHTEDLPLAAGDRFELGETYCRETLAADMPIGFHRAGESDWATHPAYEKFALEAYLGTPIRVQGNVWGTLNFSSPRARSAAFSDAEIEFVQLMAVWIGSELDRLDLEKSLRQREAELQAIYTASPIGIFVTDAEGFCQTVNPRYQDISGLSNEEAQGLGWRQAIHPDDRERVGREWHEAAVKSEVYESDHRFQRPDGQVIWTHVKAAEIRDQQQLLGYVGTVEDITSRKASEQELRRAALYDPLTDLPNRALILDRVQRAIQRGKRERDFHYALLMLDFDHFKRVNDTYGHNVGDLLLISIATRLRSALRISDSVAHLGLNCLPARLGGDEFVILLEGLNSPGDAEDVARRILDALRDPYQLQRTTIRSTASVGVAIGHRQVGDVESLIDAADKLLYQAKQQGRDQFVSGMCPAQSELTAPVIGDAQPTVQR